MSDWIPYCALLAGLLFFVGRLTALPSLGTALVASLLAAASAAALLLAADAIRAWMTTASRPDASQPSLSTSGSDA